LNSLNFISIKKGKSSQDSGFYHLQSYAGNKVKKIAQNLPGAI